MAHGLLFITGPTKETTPASFAVCLAQLFAYSREQGPWTRVELEFVQSTYVHVGRERCLEHALAIRATDVLWLDTDMAFPPETAVQLARHMRPIVGCNCVTRSTPPRFTATREGRLVDSRHAVGLEIVDTVGLAVCLMQTAVVSELARPWFTHGRTPTGTDIGEDIMFCRALSAAGHQIAIDHDLSREITHVGLYHYGPPRADLHADVLPVYPERSVCRP